MESSVLMQRVTETAGIHFSSFQKGKGEGKGRTSEEQEAIEAGGTVVESDWEPDMEWRARNLAPARDPSERNVKVLE